MSAGSGAAWKRYTECAACGKRAYPSRKVAKRAKADHPDARRLHVYHCRPGAPDWHVGYLPRAVLRGDLTRHEYYATNPETREDPS